MGVILYKDRENGEIKSEVFNEYQFTDMLSRGWRLTKENPEEAEKARLAEEEAEKARLAEEAKKELAKSKGGDKVKNKGKASDFSL